MENETNKPLPQNVEVEKALLCCIMMDEDYQEKLKEISIRAEYFYFKAHKFIFEAVEKLQTAGNNVDILTLPNQLSKMGKIHEAGGVAYLTEIYNTVSTSANILHYAEIVENPELKFIT